MIAIFAFWGFGTFEAIEMSVVHCAGLLVAAVGYLLLVFLNRKQIKTTRDTFYNMQDELDAKVNFQVEKNFATDSSPLADLAAMVDEIIARNTAKEINIEEEEQEPTPIENLIDQMESEHYARQAEEEVAKLVEESRVEEPAPVEEPTEEPAEEPASVQEEPVQETVEELVSIEQIDEEPQAEEVEEPVEEPKKEPVALKESLAAARKAGHAVVGKKFFGEYLKEKYGDALRITTVIGFPNGYNTTEVKVAETIDAIKNGADEVDMVIAVGKVKEGDYDYVLSEITALRKASAGKVLKVIVETCLLTEEEKIKMCEIVTKAGADYIKTSTGFSKAGANLADVELFKKHIGPEVKIKAAGGIRTMEDAEKYILAGAERIGASAVIKGYYQK